MNSRLANKLHLLEKYDLRAPLPWYRRLFCFHRFEMLPIVVNNTTLVFVCRKCRKREFV